MGMNTNNTFPNHFRWGVATSAYQIEGAHEAGGRTPSIWDVFSRTPGKVEDGHTGDRACDHYSLFKEDIQLLVSLGVKHYRFSVSWSRIYPREGQLNQEGIAFYRALLDELIRCGIEPMMTIYHWDLPQWIAEEGGWTNRRTVDLFVEYARTLFNAFGKDVPYWNTHNEPWCSAFLSYGVGVHAPGHTDWREAIVSAHHILLSHGLAVREYRKLGHEGQIGITLDLDANEPATDSRQDQDACRRHDGYLNRWFLDPVFKGTYPEDMVEWFRPHVGQYDFIWPGDMKVIAEKGDLLGINYYSRAIIRQGQGHAMLQTDNVLPEDCEVTDMGWEVHPESLYRILNRIREEYSSIPIYITENGAAVADRLVDGKVNDTPRIRYVQSHLEQCLRYIQDGGNLQGYYLWSFLDNFEWAFGYNKRFGMVYIDYETQERTPKESAWWYKEVMATNRVIDPISQR